MVTLFSLVAVILALLICGFAGKGRSRWMPRVKLSDLWRWDGTVDRGTYALIGVAGFAVKHNLDRLIATAVFHRKWGLFNYWIPPTEAIRITQLSPEDRAFLETMLVVAIPFIWVGVVLTLRRLRSAGLPLGWVILFFAPVLNLLFFAVLSVMPAATNGRVIAPSPYGRSRSLLDRMIPEQAFGSAAIALLITVPVACGATWLAVTRFGGYGWGLFVGLPFVLGLASVLLYGYHQPRSLPSCLMVSALSILLLGMLLVFIAFEGLLCIAMAAPVALALAMLGGWVGYVIQRRPLAPMQAPAVLGALVLALPMAMGSEYLSPAEPPLIVVRTAIEIDALPERVWSNLIAFPAISKPEEWLFRLGVSYPILATINGRGVGAARRCQFSTGTFVEAVDGWEEARRLSFSVVVQPPPLKELSPYSDLHPPHLEGYLEPRQAEFRLTPIENGRTRLEGRSTYRSALWPAEYWQLWSDAIIHRIHLRVFRQIKRLSEERR
jgi:hypothetical protein